MAEENIGKITVGIDEAGRGPVIGPMVMVALAVDPLGEKKLRWLGVKDSKLLSREVREDLFDRIREVAHDFRIEMIEPDAIDFCLADGKLNLNILEADTSARLASELEPDKIIVDCPSINQEAYKNYFASRLSTAVKDKAELIVEHKADANHISVAAASIIAKVIRDRQIDHLKNEIGEDFGSGYTSDPKTQKFLEANFNKYPHVFRKTWSTFKNAETKAKQKTLDFF